MKNLKAKIYGKVQGVFFRVFVKEVAEKLKLVGWVKNENDGTVMMEVEGEFDKLKELLQRCEEGPLVSKVDKIEHEFSDELQGYDEFKILR